MKNKMEALMIGDALRKKGFKNKYVQAIDAVDVDVATAIDNILMEAGFEKGMYKIVYTNNHVYVGPVIDK